jgi:hypothetical protein
VLEIGCGWGGFAEFAAKEVGAKVTGVTISKEQYDFAKQRMFDQGLADKADIRLIDYRDVEGQFDRVASIEMFEAVGEEYWPTYFNKIREVLAPGGRAGLQIITIRDELFAHYRLRADFIQKYVFPGGMLPSEAKLREETDKAGLEWSGVTRFGHHYADTLAEWAGASRPPGATSRAWASTSASAGSGASTSAIARPGFRTGRTDVIQLGLAQRDHHPAGGLKRRTAGCLGGRPASFEASLRYAPQDEEDGETLLILRRPPKEGLEGRMTPPHLNCARGPTKVGADRFRKRSSRPHRLQENWPCLPGPLHDLQCRLRARPD